MTQGSFTHFLDGAYVAPAGWATATVTTHAGQVGGEPCTCVVSSEPTAATRSAFAELEERIERRARSLRRFRITNPVEAWQGEAGAKCGWQFEHDDLGMVFVAELVMRTTERTIAITATGPAVARPGIQDAALGIATSLKLRESR